MTYKGKWPGTWAVICDVCGFRFPSDKLKKRWDGAMVCTKDWETRHPQTLIKINGETAVPVYVRKDNPVYLPYCSIITNSAYADLGTADCMQADNTKFTYSFLLGISTNGHE